MRGWIFVGLLLVGCSSGGGRPLDGGRDVMSFDFRFGDLPPGCPPASGNNIGVGSPCTKAGGECTNNLACTCDLSSFGVELPEGTPCFCTDVKFANPDDTRRPCEQRPAESCGDDALCCDYQTVGSLCIPNICLETSMCPILAASSPRR